MSPAGTATRRSIPPSALAMIVHLAIVLVRGTEAEVDLDWLAKLLPQRVLEALRLKPEAVLSSYGELAGLGEELGALLV